MNVPHPSRMPARLARHAPIVLALAVAGLAARRRVRHTRRVLGTSFNVPTARSSWIAGTGSGSAKKVWSV